MRDKKLYIGHTSKLWVRIKQHAEGKTKSTKDRRPLELIFYEAYLNKYDAIRREKYFKSTKGKTTLRYMLKDYLEDGIKL